LDNLSNPKNNYDHDDGKREYQWKKARQHKKESEQNVYLMAFNRSSNILTCCNVVALPFDFFIIDRLG